MRGERGGDGASKEGMGRVRCGDETTFVEAMDGGLALLQLLLRGGGGGNCAGVGGVGVDKCVGIGVSDTKEVAVVDSRLRDEQGSDTSMWVCLSLTRRVATSAFC